MKIKGIKKIAVMILSLLVASSFTIPAFATEIDVPEGMPLPANFEVADNGVYVEITDYGANTLSLGDSYEDSIGMTDEEALQLYNDYLASLPKQARASNSTNPLNDFVEYAIKQDIIENTAEQRIGITKAIVRASFKTVVSAGRAAGYKAAATLLDHSLQDHPSNLSYVSTTTIASQISKSAECKAIVNDFKSYVKRKHLMARTTSGGTTLNSTTDLHLAFNNVDYVASGTKKNNVWTLKITFSDTYNFETQAWKNAMTSNSAVTVLNNYAAYAQSLKAIVPYKVKVTVQTTFRE